MAEELKVGDSIWKYSTSPFPRVQQGTITYVGKNSYGEVTSYIVKFSSGDSWKEETIIFPEFAKGSKEELKKATLDHFDWQIAGAEKELEKLRKEREDFLKEIGE